MMKTPKTTVKDEERNMEVLAATLRVLDKRGEVVEVKAKLKIHFCNEDVPETEGDREVMEHYLRIKAADTI